jgi:3',5'-nucleoside bisphosphate phosphatase
MPARQPFTNLCRTLAEPPHHGRADLHVHTTASDGLYTPAQIVELARRSGLAAVAITDHDTLAGVGPAQVLGGRGLEVIAGVEITAEFRGREFHLLGYFIDLENTALQTALAEAQQERVRRFRAMVDRLGAMGIALAADAVETQGTALGRRHLAEMLVKAGKAGTVREAFQRYLGDHGRIIVPRQRMPVAQAIALTQGAGGVAAWAHPTYDCSEESLRELRDLGLGAIEVDYPSCRHSKQSELRRWARDLGLAVTGGSDCHGPGQPQRALGACGITADELEALRERAIVNV